MKPIIRIIFCLIIISACNSNTNRDFQNVDEFKHWIGGKTFTSDGNDLDQYDSHGTYGSPIGTLVLQFNGDLLTYQNCQPQNYEAYKDGNDWVVGFKPCSNGDLYELVIPPSGDMYVRSLDYDLSSMYKDATSNAVDRLDAIVKRQIARGPNMEITDDHPVLSPATPHLNAAEDIAKIPDTTKWVMADTNKHHFQTHIDDNKRVNINNKGYNTPTPSPNLSAQDYCDLGDGKYARQDYNGAISEYDKALTIKPDDYQIYNKRGDCKYFMQEFQEALIDYNKAISINPENGNLFNNRGNVKYSLQDYQGAIADYDKLLEFSPNSANGYLNRGNAKHQNGDNDGACLDWNKAKELGSQQAIIWINKYCTPN